MKKDGLSTEAADDSPTSGRNTSPLPHREEEYGSLFNIEFFVYFKKIPFNNSANKRKERRQNIK